MLRQRLSFAAIALALIVALLPIGQLGQAQDSLQARADAYFSEGAQTIQAADLFENLNDGDAENDPYIISLRSAEDYAKGHIPGAVNVSVKALFTLDNLATIPPDRDVVLVCYTGQTAGQATAALNLLGYQAYSLLYGMSSWTSDPSVYVKRFDPEQHTSDYIVDNDAHQPGGPYKLPFAVAQPPAEVAETVDITVVADVYFGEGPRTIQAVDLFDNLNDGDPENDPYVISLRSAEDYAKGHIPGAVNVSVKELFTLDTLATIPPDRDVVLVCYTGQTAGQATAALNMLGYDAYSLAYGMSSWTSAPDVYVKRFDPEQHTYDYIVETGAHQPGGPYELPFSVAGAQEPGQQPTPQPEAQTAAVAAPAQNCVTCHTNQAILEILAVEEEEVQSEESAGEG
jgi:rhodanese-related sulfurtransferase